MSKAVFKTSRYNVMGFLLHNNDLTKALVFIEHL